MNETQSTAADVANAYRILLGRPAEDDEVCNSQAGPTVNRLIGSFWGSPEFTSILASLREGLEIAGRFPGAPTPRDVRWVAATFPLAADGRERLASVDSWSALYRILLSDAALIEQLGDAALDWNPQELLPYLDRWPDIFPASTDAGPSDVFARHTAGGNHALVARLPADFDASIYGRYADARENPGGLAEHYRRVGVHEGRVYNQLGYEHRRHTLKDAIDAPLYLSQRPQIDPADILDDWIFHGSVTGLQPNHDFSADYYGTLYHDLAELDIDLYEHFVMHGRAEGRQAIFNVEGFLQKGGKSWKMLAPTIVLATHEASRTGAPILALALMRYINRTHNVILLMPKGGELFDDFQAECGVYGIGYLNILDGKALIRSVREQFLAEAIIINSVGTNYMAGPALLGDLPSVGLIHEFASYTKPVTEMIRMVEQIDVAVTPADLIAEQINAESEIYRGGPTSNLVVRPQGYIVPARTERSRRDMTVEAIRNALNIRPGEDPAIVLGGGTVQMRKGVDLFVQTAAALKRISSRPVKFLWAGHGYDPEYDLTYSMYIDYMIDALDLRDDIFFAQPQQQFDLMIGMADVFFISSRQDPFPNVALDAFAADKPVVCFERATGIAEAIRTHGFVGAAAPFCDVAEAARLIDGFIAAGPVGGRNWTIIEERFRFADYAEAILGHVEDAKRITAERRRMADEIELGPCFDATYHECRRIVRGEERADAIRYYVARAQKGLLWRNPRPGLNEGAAIAAAASAGEPALLSLAATVGEACPSTHRSLDLDRLAAPREAPALRVVLHLHFHYSDIAFEFADLCEAARMKADIVISTTTSAGHYECGFAFRNYTGGKVTTIETDNIGRDIGPFVRELPRIVDLEQYDLVGHLHGKRSSVLPAMGDRWRKFLLDALIGDGATYKKLLGLFAQRSSLGMIFAEDSHSVGWGKNLPFAAEVASRLSPNPAIPAYPIFPIGTMFWARPAALRSVWNSPDLLAGLSGEPLPYDGTVLHAFERLLPSIVESNGHDWSTVHRSGKGW